MSTIGFIPFVVSVIGAFLVGAVIAFSWESHTAKKAAEAALGFRRGGSETADQRRDQDVGNKKERSHH